MGLYLYFKTDISYLISLCLSQLSPKSKTTSKIYLLEPTVLQGLLEEDIKMRRWHVLNFMQISDKTIFKLK